MRIVSSELQLAASHQREERHEIRESLRMWVGARPDATPASPLPAASAGERVSLSDAGRLAAEQNQTGAVDEAEMASEDPRTQLIRLMLEALTGKRLRVFDARELSASAAAANAAASPPPTEAAAAEAARPAGYGVEYERYESYREAEQTDFRASGRVRTADGREIAFELQLTVARSYQMESTTSLRLGDAVRKVDPLVINFGGKAAELVDQRFAFDLNADGSPEQIAQLAAGSGYLVFDRNADGRINDGSEMFGPASGDGFADLAALDDDGNGWIDENDSAFGKLSIWNPSTADGGTGSGLLAAGVGAIALGRVATPFDLTGNANALLGQIRTSGIFLHEDGTAGTIQQIDLSA